MITKVKGVYLDKRHNKWKASMVNNGDVINLGTFKTYEEAVKARKEGEIEHGFVHVTPAPKLKHKNDLTQEELKSLLHYDPETGYFTWRVKTNSSIKIGSVAGGLATQGYTVIRIDNKDYRAHRLAFLYMEGKFPEKGLYVDHINHKTSDNRWCNLRIVTHQENMRNSSLYKNNTAGHTGVYWLESVHKWVSKIRINKKLEHLGYFKNKDDAIAARKAAELKNNFHENHGKLNQNQIKEVI